MGSSKIIFVGAVAVIIGMFGFGIKKAERSSAEIAENHAFQLQAKALAEQGLQVVIRRLPRNTHAKVPRAKTKDVTEGQYGYSVDASNVASGTVSVTSYGIVNTQKVTLVTVLKTIPRGKKPTGKSWNGWVLESSRKVVETVPMLEKKAKRGRRR